MCKHSQDRGYLASTQDAENQAQSLFIGIMGSPFDNDLITSVFRISEAALQSGKDLVIWTCGYATQITQSTSIRTADPIRSIESQEGSNFTLAQIAQTLLTKYPKQLRWYVCQYCMEERGATSQIPEVEILLPFSFNSYLNQADQSLVVGVK